jgi:hypothetical protein
MCGGVSQVKIDEYSELAEKMEAGRVQTIESLSAVRRPLRPLWRLC